MPRGNVKNLIKSKDLTPEQRRKNASKAGKASVKAKKEAKSFKAMLVALLDIPMEELENVSPRLAIIKGMIIKAAGGDKGAADWVRDTSGEKPVDKQEGNFTGKIIYGWENGDQEDNDTL